MLQLFVSRRIG